MSKLPPLRPASTDDVDTEPGVGLLSLKQENARLRRERDDARANLSEAPPPPTPKQKTVKAALAGTKYAVLVPVVAFAARAAARKWPQITDTVDAVLQALGL